MYRIKQSKSFSKSLKKLVRLHRIDIDQINYIFFLLAKDPFTRSLKTHKVNSKKHGVQYSSRVDGDLRLVWNFDNDNNLVIIIADIGGHSGSSKVY